MLVYHSSNQQFAKPYILHSREALDFGKGFYVTRLKDQAEKYASRFLRAGEDAYMQFFHQYYSLKYSAPCSQALWIR